MGYCAGPDALASDDERGMVNAVGIEPTTY